jgi:hypothetical protein
MKLLTILQEMSRGDAHSRLTSHFLDCSRKYFSQYTGKFPAPKILIKPNMGGGRKSGEFNPNNNSITINADTALGEISSKATMYHETIHYFIYHLYGGRSWEYMYKAGHGPTFVEWMNKINAGEGEEVVSISTTITKRSKAEKPYTVLVMLTPDGEMSSAWYSSPQPQLLPQLSEKKKKGRYKAIYFFETDEAIWKIAVRQPHGRLEKTSRFSRGYEYFDVLKASLDAAIKNGTAQEVDDQLKDPNTTSTVVKPYYALVFVRQNGSYLYAWCATEPALDQQIRFVGLKKSNSIKDVFLFKTDSPYWMTSRRFLPKKWAGYLATALVGSDDHDRLSKSLQVENPPELEDQLRSKGAIP